MTDKLTNPTVLAFERKLDPSDALFFGGNWNDRQSDANWESIALREKSVRGTASHRSKAKGGADPSKQDMKFESPNPQTVDVAALPPQADTLKVHFTLRVLGGAGTPSACNSAAYQAKLLASVQGYKQQHGFAELARRYAANLANGRFLWRNRVGAESVEVTVEQMQDGKAQNTWCFDALALNTRSLTAINNEAKGVTELGQAMASGLAGTSHVLLRVTAFVRQGAGQEVFPSQELILDKGSAGKSKTLYDVGGVAAIHSQKIGNAIRTIDTWYEGAAELGPIAVEPYGSVTTQGKAYRQPKQKLDFYTLLDNWLLKDQVPPVEQQHFVMAVLIRGGVFGDAS